MPERSWQSYDSIAETYERVAALCHAQLARDLIAAVAPPFGAAVLDVGAGTGIAADAARAATGPAGRVVALDPSAALLGRTDPARVLRVAGEAPGLPFGSGGFDVVVANLVVGHFADYEHALADLVRVLRPGGRLGITTWGRTDDAPDIDNDDERRAYAVWDDVMANRVDLDEADEHAAAALPWEAAFTKPAFIGNALADVNLWIVETIGRAYRYPLSHADWLARVSTSARGRYVRERLGPATYERASNEVMTSLGADGVADPIRCADEALITVATLTRPDRGSR